MLTSAILVGKLDSLGLDALKALFSSPALPGVILVGSLIAAATAFFGIFGIRFHGMLSMIFSGLPMFCVLRLLGVSSAAQISAGAAAGLMIFGFIFSEGYFAIERSVLGAMLATSAASMAFGLSSSICMVVFTAVGVAGSVTGFAVEIARDIKAKKARANGQSVQ